MNRNDLAKELKVSPWDVDDWLLWGCPAEKIRSIWDFNLRQVKDWLRTEKIKLKRIRSRHLSERPLLDERWLGKSCPVCMDNGFPEEEAGRLYTLGRNVEGKWHIVRSGFPCGHSSDFMKVGI